MESYYDRVGYHITTDPSFQHAALNLPAELIAQYEQLYVASQNKKDKKITTKLRELISKYPQSPQLKDFLSVAYHAHGDHKKGNEITRQTIEAHPAYLFAKLNLAFQYIAPGQSHKIPEAKCYRLLVHLACFRINLA